MPARAHVNWLFTVNDPTARPGAVSDRWRPSRLGRNGGSPLTCQVIERLGRNQSAHHACGIAGQPLVDAEIRNWCPAGESAAILCLSRLYSGILSEVVSHRAGSSPPPAAARSLPSPLPCRWICRLVCPNNVAMADGDLVRRSFDLGEDIFGKRPPKVSFLLFFRSLRVNWRSATLHRKSRPIGDDVGLERDRLWPALGNALTWSMTIWSM